MIIPYLPHTTHNPSTKSRLNPLHHDQNHNPKWIRFVHIITSCTWLVHDPTVSLSRFPSFFLFLFSSLSYSSLMPNTPLFLDFWRMLHLWSLSQISSKPVAHFPKIAYSNKTPTLTCGSSRATQEVFSSCIDFFSA
jgi:hypothetical protein